MKIAIFAKNSSDSYSGGRYHTWVMAEALSRVGHEVNYITDNIPAFYEDFDVYPKHNNIEVTITNNFITALPTGAWDLVFIVPSGKWLGFYLKVKNFAREKGACLVLLNFETPNWYNKLSPTTRDPSIWDNIEKISRETNLILSSSKEGNKYAKRFFNNVSKNTKFDFCYPAINNTVADSVEAQAEDRIVFFARFFNAEHKGSRDITKIINKNMTSYTLVLIVGAGGIPSGLKDKILHEGKKFGVEIEIKKKISDYEKFREIKSAALLLFPSYFEGFGYPPIEAQYCNVPVVAFDLPVLREVSGNVIFYVEPGNWSQFRKKVGEVLNTGENFDYLKTNVKNVAKFENYGRRINKIVEDLKESNCEAKMEKPSTAKLFLAELIRFSFQIGGKISGFLDKLLT